MHLFDEEWCLAASPRSRWTRLRKLSFADLVDASWITPYSGAKRRKKRCSRHFARTGCRRRAWSSKRYRGSCATFSAYAAHSLPWYRRHS